MHSLQILSYTCTARSPCLAPEECRGGCYARAGSLCPPAQLTNEGHHQDVLPALQQSSQTGQVVNEAVGIWYEEQGSDLQLHLPHLTLIFQNSLQGHRM